MRWQIGCAAACVIAVASSPAFAVTRRLSMEDAVQAAIDASPAIQAARARTNAARDQALSTRGRFLFPIHVSDEQQHFNDNFAVKFAFPGAPGPAPEFVARQINTNSFAIGAQQPVVGLLAIDQDYAAANSVVTANEDNVKTLEASVREQMQIQLYRLFEARATKEISAASVQQLEDQLQVTKSRVDAGVATNADLLRITTALANARQQVIQAEVGEQVSLQGVLTSLGLPVDTADLDFVEPNSPENYSNPAFAEAVKTAESKRPELAGARASVAAAYHAANARAWRLLPDVNLEAAYVHLTGQILAPKDEAYVGLKVDWNVFAWGADWYAKEAAAEQAAATDAEAEGTRRNIDLDLAAKLSTARSAAVAVDVARTSIASAEEAYRVTDALVKAGSATTTDLLVDQSALTTARLNLVRARYEQAIVQTQLVRALGGGT